MSGKLLKYEWTAMMRSMLPVYAGVAAVTVLNALMFQVLMPGAENAGLFSIPFVGMLPGISGTLYVAALAVLCVFTLIMLIQRFYKGLLKDEGYLMLTLPVEPWKIVLSKAVVSAVMMVLSCLVGIFSIGILLGGFSFLKALPEFFGDVLFALRRGFEENASLTLHGVLYGVELLFLMAASCFATIYHFYFAMALGQLAGNHRIAASVLAYVGISAVFSMAATGFLQTYPLWEPFLENLDMVPALHVTLLAFLLEQVAEAVIQALGTGYILKNHLNLE